MTADHLGGISRAGVDYLPGPGYTFGLGFAVRETTGLSSLNGSAGEYNWGGAGGTFFWVDPKEQLIGVFMAQAPSQRAYLRSLFKNLVVQSILN
jgi:CubicO group peptidase (beta-lactamase class C family)